MSNSFAPLGLSAAMLIGGAPPSLAQVTAWQIDPAHSAAQFTVRHLMIANVKGEFSKVSGVVNLDGRDITKSFAEVTIDTTTVNTGEPKRDAHLRSADFFDVERYPTMTFRSKRITPAGEGKFKMTGDLTIRGVTREVTFDVEGPTPAIRDPWGNARAGATATARIYRKDFNVLWNATIDGGGVVVGDEVTITMDVEMFKKAAPRSPANGGK